MTKIEPRTLKGFRDYLPETMIPRERLIETARRVYRSYGFAPIDTPALEYLDVLTGKGSDETDKQLYRFQDHGDRWVGLRFDLTVPLARFAAQYANTLGLPFKRYHVATVWRGENTQRGRYREFVQCDFDTIGTLALAADVETALVINDLFQALGFSDFTIRLNNRQVLSGLLDVLGLSEQTVPVLRALDKLGKIGPAKVAEELETAAGATAAQSRQVVALADLQGANDSILAELERLTVGSELAQTGIARLRDLLAATRAAGVPEERLQLDPSIARGLDYYTGVIFETFLDKLPTIGSVCSGGRYDNLAAMFTNQQLPGIGASLGLDRLLAAMEELGMIDKVATPCPVLLTQFDAKFLPQYLKLAAELRAAGIGVELYPEAKKLGQQLKYADKRGFRVALVAGEDEFAAGTVQVKDLGSGETVQAKGAEVVAAVKRVLSVNPAPNGAAEVSPGR